MMNVVVVIGPGQIGQVVACRVGVGKHNGRRCDRIIRRTASFTNGD